MISIIAMLLGIAGAILNARLIVWGFAVWLVANNLWIYKYWGVDWGLVGLNLFYNGVCVLGIYTWLKKLRKEEKNA